MVFSVFGSMTEGRLFRKHIEEMRVYADQLEDVLGKKSPIVKRIRSCADSNAAALDRIAARKAAAEQSA